MHHHHEEAAGVDGLVGAFRDARGRTHFAFVRIMDTAHLGFAVRRMSGKGLGVVAMKAFPAGERILAESPLVAWRTRPEPADSSGRKLHDFKELRDLIASLDAPSREAFLGLADNYASPEKSIAGIWNTNSIKTEDVMGDSQSEAKDGLSRTAVFAQLSRFNHACVPNTFPAWNALLGQQTVHALRDIAPGEELCIAYVAGAEAGHRDARQALLLRKYKFACDCVTCSLTGTALENSDARQQRLASIHTALTSWPDNDPALPTVVEESLWLMNEEGLPPVWGKAGVFLLVAQLVTQGDRRGAAKWARRGAIAARPALGEDSSVFRRFSELVEALGEPMEAS